MQNACAPTGKPSCSPQPSAALSPKQNGIGPASQLGTAGSWPVTVSLLEAPAHLTNPKKSRPPLRGGSNSNRKEAPQMPTAIVYGPPACGKTSHAKQIAEHLGIDPANIVDDWRPRKGRYPYLQPGYLHLSQEVPAKVRNHCDGLAIPVPSNVIVRPFSSFIFASQEGQTNG
jgi:hypothetical protein